MSGVKGRSGGARPGAGRPPKEPAYLNLSVTYDEPAKFLKAVMNDSGTEAKLRIDAAKALLSAEVRRGENGGKKAARAGAAATRAKSGKYASAAPPNLQ
ncbi:hypothetical protein DR66_2570 [Delftia acidovorans]|uniref:hypothetical protein n=1 Tax=Delftia TaxID=80865 RepID=UPI000507D90F|nr:MULTISPECIES: hypothetical protein [Delftia]KFJ09271.1 hypothetical protein DR66_2570 [Delftia acidovorans]QQB52757.1 hypothetical protein I6H54_11050 [Delftia acidovorans]CAB5708958.1 Uncharacterised protein [Delftia tsuruhatensis]CAC9685485.1 Uncharacterised protein [Delftia tsuruhatensis]